ncbi:ApaG domain [Akkermansiaceae bacterium]|nr:ApaG domain [Akkermansiaceae bacterium]
MPDGYQEISGLRVEVEEVNFNPNLEAPEERPYPFVYFISIINDSNEALTIWGRKWILKDVTGEMMVVEGSGVVGENPFLLPGERFSYNSYHVIGKDSRVSGSFFGTSEHGAKVRVTIPGFNLVVPDSIT